MCPVQGDSFSARGQPLAGTASLACGSGFCIRNSFSFVLGPQWGCVPRPSTIIQVAIWVGQVGQSTALFYLGPLEKSLKGT